MEYYVVFIESEYGEDTYSIFNDIDKAKAEAKDWSDRGWDTSIHRLIEVK